RKFVVLAHGSIFSKVGASSKPGAIHFRTSARQLLVTKNHAWDSQFGMIRARSRSMQASP
ncbi:hypothetical protein, partial [Burkholderia multivorans]|uniref:hypothetical protein n=1 Tax=Burkholderia multivorans TaxID=87883 RepID=UPI002870997F